MTKGKLTSSILSVVMAAGLLAGCGTSGGNAGTGTDTANQPGKAAETPAASGDQVVNVYTARHYESDDKLMEAFTQKTGIKVNTVKGKAEELIERLKREGESTEADLFITVDGGVLNTAKENGVLQPIQSETVDKHVPKHLRDKDNEWIGIATRARVIAYSKERVKPEDLSTYEDLATDKWKGKVLVRSSTSLYNQSLLASFIELNGEAKTEEWAKGIVANMAQEPKGGDRDQAKAIVAGVGDVAIMNTYYVGLLLNSKDPEEVKVGESIGVFFPNQETTGTHLNISGVGLTKHSKNKENAIKLIEFLTDKEAQSMLSQSNYEFPVNAEAEMPELLKSWGEFKAQEIDFAALGTHNKKALEISNKVGWK
ncbi:Fe(3+) ABC transporter substrate-binding protein [Brevibacillus composti]|uniref:Fe(3+) ABC transporter substrate-binding protein n=1 Tax=Brevibacillus composti TaxID=2796470 RepID=A0A7T5JNB7_9BACL|nr:Fe(3+) ABC transporter substrate-binding protein [Brevibacillus composti]QQE73845.1 Fe(3+) ABC transporter substrate-binding protein [Brevibacillus composti]QUO40930.1 Fe(3+) ABC transporter substrate-binding protein [Brevibacillus composti]